MSLSLNQRINMRALSPLSPSVRLTDYQLMAVFDGYYQLAHFRLHGVRFNDAYKHLCGIDHCKHCLESADGGGPYCLTCDGEIIRSDYQAWRILVRQLKRRNKK